MASVDLNIGMILLFQTVVGILGNFSLLYHCTSLYFRGCKLRATDWIIGHLTAANCLVILSRGVPETMAALGLKHSATYHECHLLLYVHRVARGMSICSTCLLSICQAVTIHPGNSRWAELKVKSPKYVVLSCTLCWVLHMVGSMFFPIFVTGQWSNKNITKKRDFRYCPAWWHSAKIASSVYATVTSFHDSLCLGLMTLASSSMVFVLYRHKQRVQHIRRNSLSPKPSPETRATRSIVVLVTTFLLFYALSSIIYIYLAFFSDSKRWLINAAVLITACFSTVSPFVLMSHDLSMRQLYCACCGRNT
ncbi:vomeronasal type-1 receptor 2 [Mustela erminea]|uniref:vomeronasal type-1 receptor 2 n=1 Tax=Mustela erminea TaxID=36723 RepID=UPI001387526A|nr:vomeronasal type-1 receptor 2 [Mustela erminea]